MSKILAILNSLSVLLVIIWNYWVNSEGLNGNTVSSVSQSYDNLFTPASYAFSIWGFIFLGLLASSFFMLVTAFKDKDRPGIEQIEKLSYWLIIANILNAVWLYVWLSENIAASVIVMIGILVSLHAAMIKLNMAKWYAPKRIIAFIWWPIMLYAGWITVATVANISAYLVKIDYNLFFSETVWTVIIVTITTLLMIFVVLTRFSRVYGLVGVWALLAISYKHWGSNDLLTIVTLAGAVSILTTVALQGYKYKERNPFNPMNNL